MKVAIYIRVSTQEQVKEGYSIGEQEESLRTYCRLREWDIYDVYSDPGFSGGSLSRPAIQRLIDESERKLFDLVLVKKLDRLSRRQKDTLYLIEDVFEKYGISFMSMTENFDTSTPIGKAFLGILSTFAQLERDTIKERTSTGRQERAKAGYFHGGGYAPIGYRYIDGQLIIDEYESLQVREVYRLFLEGNSIYSICQYMQKTYTNVYSSWNHVSSIYSCLKTIVYTGKVTFNGKTYDGLHEAIISDETFQTAQNRFAQLEREALLIGKKNKSAFKHTNLLGGLLHCAQCGASYYTKGNYSGHKYPDGRDNRVYHPYYTCYSRGKTVKKMIRDPNCKNKSWNVSELDKIITDIVVHMATDHEYFLSVISADANNDSSRLKEHTLRNRIQDIDQQINRLVDLYQMGNFPLDEITKRSQSLQQERSALVKELANLQDGKNSCGIGDALTILAGTQEIFSSGTMEQKQALMHSLIEYIDLDGENIVIHWTFT